MKVLVIAGHHQGYVVDLLYGDEIRLAENGEAQCIPSDLLPTRDPTRIHSYKVVKTDSVGFAAPREMTEDAMQFHAPDSMSEAVGGEFGFYRLVCLDRVENK